MTTQQTPAPAGRMPTIGVLVAAAALIFSFFAQGFAILLALAALVLGLVLVLRRRPGNPGRGAGFATLAVAVLALVIGAATSTTPPAPQASAPTPVVDPNALPATVTIASAQAPADLLTTTGRRLHVTAMQGGAAATACQTASGVETAARLVVGQLVQVAAPDVARIDVPTAVSAGFQPVVLTLPDGRDYAQAWSTTAPSAAAAACTPTTTTTTEPPPTTTEEPAPTTTVEDEPDVDVDRPYVPAPPRPRTRSGRSGHPCLPGERDGDGDGYCGE